MQATESPKPEEWIGNGLNMRDSAPSEEHREQQKLSLNSASGYIELHSGGGGYMREIGTMAFLQESRGLFGVKNRAFPAFWH